MAPPKADGWPAYIYNDPDVLTLDERGRFIICHVCAEYYATCGGKKPKPVTLNGCYRTRAWEVHKQRTRAHNTRRGGRSLAARAPVMPESDDSPSLPPSFGAMLDRQPYEMRSIDHDASMTRVFNEPPLRDRRRSMSPPPRSPSPPPAPITTWLPQNTVASQSFAREYDPKTSTSRTQPRDSTYSTLVFPLVRSRSELRNWSDFDPAWCETSSGYDWRRRPSSSRPSLFRFEHRSMGTTSPHRFMSRSYGEPQKAPAYAVPEGLR